MKKRMLFFLLVCTFPAWVALNIWQSFRFERLQAEIAGLEKDQQALLEENRQLLMSIEALSSPDRIERIAVSELGLRRTRPDRVTKILLPGNGGRRGL